MAKNKATDQGFDVPREERREDYEMTVVLSASAENEAREKFIERLKNFIADENGEVIEVSPTKQQPLAYPIRKERQGVYITLVFRSSRDLPNRVADAFRHDPVLLRQLTIERPKASNAPIFSLNPGVPEPSVSSESPEAFL